ncbi:uncharacterized protein EAF02_007314 [Botrytis sinoallii]|uniref:uncharacterized protein n=1 Tax=Botrytis sinoallii TaxID=1463999 RepID=UPI00190164BF|nr:uncharacterized protein EAF02_007314 [Botrytis sinoallii]KAF7880468.1 hypothetical protein EAF02_007314 [Botrytis sinoallii]
MAKYTRKLTPIVGDERRRKRACHDRTQTVMKKGDELAVLCPGTRVWVIVQNDEQTCIYSSEESSSLPVLSGNDNVISTGPGDYRTHNEAMATGLTSSTRYTPPPSTAQSATSFVPAATSPPVTNSAPSTMSSPPMPVSSSSYTRGIKRTNSALDRGRTFLNPYDVPNDDEEGSERMSRPRKYLGEAGHSNPRRSISRIKDEMISRSLMREIPEFRSSRERSSSGSRVHV